MSKKKDERALDALIVSAMKAAQKNDYEPITEEVPEQVSMAMQRLDESVCSILAGEKSVTREYSQNREPEMVETSSHMVFEGDENLLPEAEEEIEEKREALLESEDDEPEDSEEA